MLALCNATIFNGSSTITGKAILTEENIIKGMVPEDAIPSHAQKIDLTNQFIAPAFIDLQLYGGNGLLFSQALNEDAIRATDAYCISGGCTRSLLTLATNSIELFVKGIDVAKAFLQKNPESGFMGLHLEGPYINAAKRGAHLLQHIKEPTLDEVKMLVEHSEGVIKMITLAPEQCSDEVIQFLLDSRIIVSAGHSNATYGQATSAFNKGITAATHLFNAMSPFLGREPGMVGAVLNHHQVCCSIVCDGVHTDFASVTISKKIMGERLFLITDAVTETLEGSYQHLLKNDRYVLPDGTLSGSSLTMIKAVNNCVKQVGIELNEALRMASLYPARVIGMDHCSGKIEEGYVADLVVLDQQLSVQSVMRNGGFIDEV